MHKKYDLITIGAGVLGTFHAYHALRKGLKVLLLEKDQYPVNATVRNFGQCVPSGLSSNWFEYGRRSTNVYNDIQKEFDITVRNNGSVYIASNESEQSVLHELKSVMAGRKYECDIFSHHQCLERWADLRGEYVREGLFFPQEISVEPETMIYRLIEYCIIKFPGLTYRSGTAVVGCDIVSDQVVVTLADRTSFIGNKAVICNGHEFKILFADLFNNSGIVVSKLQMMRTYPMPNIKMEGNILTGLTIHRYESFQECPSFKSLVSHYEHQELRKWGIHILFKKATDGSIIIGDSHEYADVGETDNLGFNVSTKINDLMLTEAQRIVSFNIKNIATTWAGFYSQHPEKNIVEYDLEDRIHIRTAIGGKGMSSSAGYAEKSIEGIFD